MFRKDDTTSQATVNIPVSNEEKQYTLSKHTWNAYDSHRWWTYDAFVQIFSVQSEKRRLRAVLFKYTENRIKEKFFQVEYTCHEINLF